MTRSAVNRYGFVAVVPAVFDPRDPAARMRGYALAARLNAAGITAGLTEPRGCMDAPIVIVSTARPDWQDLVSALEQRAVVLADVTQPWSALTGTDPAANKPAAALARVDAVTAASLSLCERVSEQIKRKVLWVPDLTDPAAVPPPAADPRAQNGKTVKLGWLGNADRVPSLLGLGPVLAHAFRNSPVPLELVAVTAGFRTAPDESGALSNFDLLARLPVPYRFRPWSPEKAAEATADIDIGLVPEHENAVTSASRIAHFALQGALPLVSDSPEHRRLLQGARAEELLCAGPAAWTQMLRCAIADREWARQTAARVREHVQKLFSEQAVLGAWLGAVDAAVAAKAEKKWPRNLSRQIPQQGFVERLVTVEWHNLLLGGIKTVHLFGAGAHTRWLLQLIAEKPGPRVCAILDERPATDRLETFPVCALEQADWKTADAVVLSTDIHQKAMRERLDRVAADPPLRIVDLYENLPPGPYPKTFA